MTRIYRCLSCGAAWVRHLEGEAMEGPGRCLRCDGVTVPEESTAGTDTETDAPPPVPNGLEDDAET